MIIDTNLMNMNINEIKKVKGKQQTNAQILLHRDIINKKRRNATKPGFQRFNQVLIWQESEMKDGSEEKMMPLFLLHWLHKVWCK